MADGIVCKVWNIKGNVSSKTSSAQLNDSLSYILNSEKTNYNVDFENSFLEDPESQLSRECKYIENDIKTMSGAYVGTHNLYSKDVKNAVNEMMETKKFFKKLDGRAALHLLISLPEIESDPDNAPALMQLCENVLKELFPDHQAVFAVHTNTDNLHIHCIINSVGLNGKKIHQPKMFVKNVLQPCVNKYAERFGFSKNNKWDKTVESSSFVDNKIYLRKCIDLAIEKSNTFDDFISELKKMKVSVRVGKHLSLSTDEMQKPIRSFRLGENYSIESIVDRIENRLEKFKIPSVENVSFGTKIDEILSPETVPLMRYKNMNSKQKEKVLKVLKLGRNPWRENQMSNWQLNNIANELNLEYRISEYRKLFSVDGSVVGVLDGISSVQDYFKNLRKQLRDLLKRNKPVIDIFNKMSEIERKAFLYEHMGISDYRFEFEEYRNLTYRLKDGYDKTVFDVSNFVGEVNDMLLYCNNALKELSLEYKETKKYAEKRGFIFQNEHSFVDSVGVFDDISYERQGVFDVKSYYIASKDTECIARIEKTPGVDSAGNLKEIHKISILSRNGELLEQVSNEFGNKGFNQLLREIGKKYGFSKDCKKFSNLYMAKDYSGLNQIEVSTEKQENILGQIALFNTQTNKEQHRYSFTQAINLKSVGNRDGSHIIMNYDNPMYRGVLMTNEDYIRFSVLDSKGDIVKIFTIPSFSKRNDDGFKMIKAIRDEYGFSDDIVSFDNKSEAERYYEDCQKKKNSESKENVRTK